MDEITLSPVAYVSTDFNEKFGIPRQSGRCPSSIGVLAFVKPYNSVDFIRGIEEFSHLWLLFGFSANRGATINATVRPPRLGGNERVGVFATRSPFRPNGIGLSCVKLESVLTEGKTIQLKISGADLLDGTPVYDVKPYIPSTDARSEAFGGFSEQFTDYKLSVVFPDEYAALIEKEKLQALKECLADDPRPAYQEDGRIYVMSYAKNEIRFTVTEKTLTVLSVKEL